MDDKIILVLGWLLLCIATIMILYEVFDKLAVTLLIISNFCIIYFGSIHIFKKN